MNHLAIETSGRFGSVALYAGPQLLYAADLPQEQRTTQSLAPQLERAVSHLSGGRKDLGLISVAIGPGSFTGLRVGVTTAKTLAYGLSAAVLGVSTLEILAVQGWEALHLPHGFSGAENRPSLAGDAILATAISAYRGQVYGALWSASGSIAGERRRPDTCLLLEDWQSLLGELAAGGSVVALGDGCRHGVASATVALLPESTWRPSAITLGKIAWEKYCQGERSNVWTLEPEYLRPSAAEEQSGMVP